MRALLNNPSSNLYADAASNGTESPIAPLAELAIDRTFVGGAELRLNKNRAALPTICSLDASTGASALAGTAALGAR